MAIEEWPRISDTTLSGTPRVSSTLAAECRSVCSPACGGPALLRGGPERPEGVAGVAGLTQLGGEDEAGLFHPRRRRGVVPPAWADSMMKQSRSAGLEMGTNRLDAAVLGSVTTSSPSIPGQGAANPQRAAGQVDVRPLQGECLAAAETGVHEEREQRCVPAALGSAPPPGAL